MGFPLKKVVELSAAILKLTPLAPVGVAVDLGADLFPDDSPDDRAWKIKKIPEWKKLCAGLMNIPMSDEIRGATLKGRMAADFYAQFGELPRDQDLETWHREIVLVVKAELAATIPEG